MRKINHTQYESPFIRGGYVRSLTTDTVYRVITVTGLTTAVVEALDGSHQFVADDCWYGWVETTCPTCDDTSAWCPAAQ